MRIHVNTAGTASCSFDHDETPLRKRAIKWQQRGFGKASAKPWLVLSILGLTICPSTPAPVYSALKHRSCAKGSTFLSLRSC